MSSRIYIGHLSTRATERDVEKFFRNFGRLREVIIKDGFGFIEFESSRDASDAVYELNGKELCGERVIVELSRPRGSAGGRDDRYDDRRAPPRINSRFGAPVQTRYRLAVSNLTTRYSWQDLKDLMRGAGDVTYADAHKLEKNTGVVCFREHRDLKRAIEKFQDKDINGRKIKLIDETQGASRSRSRSRSHSHHRDRKRSRSRSASHSPRAKRSRSGSPKSRSPKSRSPKSRSPKSRSPHSASPKSRSGSPAAAAATSNGAVAVPAAADTTKEGSVEKDNGHSRSASPASRQSEHSASASRD